jgi:hypothetical protein
MCAVHKDIAEVPCWNRHELYMADGEMKVARHGSIRVQNERGKQMQFIKRTDHCEWDPMRMITALKIRSFGKLKT